MSAALLAVTAGVVCPNEPVVFGTDWLAQAEHGGFYQSVANGTYAARLLNGLTPVSG